MGVYDPNLNGGYGGYRSNPYTMKGVPDIVCIINGMFVGFEVKTTKGRVSPDQLLFKKRCERAGGIYHVVRSADEALKLLASLGSPTKLR